ncbi:MAG TPA: DUF2780 domain-containing protein [Burkholderiales bacterium]|nr:DUF2780 domain-containing protein [Burkholderiales bacterium]
MADLGVTTPELTKDLAKNLGVTEAQAAGGVGAMFQQAAEKLTAVDFDSIRNSAPGVDQYLKASQNALGGAKLSDIGGLQGAFKKLGLTPEMVAQFKPYVLDYVGKYSPSARSTLAPVL